MTNQIGGRRRDGLGVVIVASVVAGAIVVAVSLATGDRRAARPGAPPRGATEEYGHRLLSRTGELLGPDSAMAVTGTRMRCTSCHLADGASPGMLSLLEAAANYPKFSGRDGGVRDLQDRINGCLERSMNGRALPRDGVELVAMATYVESLHDQWAAMAPGQRAAHEQRAFTMPDRAANPEQGRQVYVERCAICHGADGNGLPASTHAADGYMFPPLWGPGSFNSGAGMHRVLTAARFIKAKMPLGQADLTDDQAFDVAAYINAQPRPEMAGLERDYPDRTTKPVDCPYGPYADPFPPEQHRVGPFIPIQQYYAARKRAASH
jgi:thiosulfate dehydrogenase